jgi:dolichyl-phosphate-mannose-protein mannosyltransferase
MTAKKTWTPEVLALTLAAFATHFWRLFRPHAAVFDEVYSESFAGHYLAHSFYLDVHPPLARLMIAATARLLGLAPASLIAREPAVALRIVPALLGALAIPVVYLILRKLNTGRRIATLGAAFVLLDNALLVESRLDLPESILIFFGLTAMLAYLAARQETGGLRWARLALAATLAGCALSVKWTGASALGVILAAWFIESLIARVPVRRLLAEGAVLVLLPAAVYVATFIVHFALLTHTGGVYDVAMSPRFQATLIGNPHYDPRVHLSFLEKFFETHRAIMGENTAFIGATHIGASRWYTWPIMKHPILFWVDEKARPMSCFVILLGNPLVWWGSLAGSIAGLVLFAVRRVRWAGHEFALAFLLGAYLLNFAPFAGIRRVMFLYHYLFALTCIAMLGALSIGVLAGWTGDDERHFAFSSPRSAVAYWSLLTVVAISFVYFAAFTYAVPIGQSSVDFHFWLLHPRF